MSKIQPRKIKLLDAITATTTSIAVPVSNAGRLSLMIYGNNISSGNGVFTVNVSNEQELGAANCVRYNRLTTNVTNTNAQFDIRAANATLSANSTAMLFFPATDTFASISVNCVVTTDGKYSAVLYVD